MNPMSLLTMSPDHLREQSQRQQERAVHVGKPFAKMSVAVVLFSTFISGAIVFLAR